MTSLGERIKELREAKGWSRVILAQKAEVSRHTIGRVERGTHKPQLAHLYQIAQALGVAVAELTSDKPMLLCPRLGAGYCEREGCAIWLPGGCAERVAAEQLILIAEHLARVAYRGNIPLPPGVTIPPQTWYPPRAETSAPSREPL